MSTYTALVHNSNSFHPISRLLFRLSRSTVELVSGNCSLHLFYQLSSSLFVDPYELAQRQQSYTFVRWGHADLEKPVHAVANSDTNVLINVNVPLSLPEDENGGKQLDVEVPLHARYGVPLTSTSPNVGSGNYQGLVLEPPEAFIACPNGFLPPERGQELSTPPAHLSESQLREADLAPEATHFTHIPHSLSDHPVNIIRIPTGHEQYLLLVQSGTAIVILLSFFCVSIVAVRTAVRLSSGAHTKTE
ncbi:hypothetical protein P691DRAFT_760813 [Macrolepiota fuliginosa MF-IS2]|uniref:Protein PBN1 n=1 Tax=Macrolepiota fuliginosa MF-IS2 TaxID=1400762 RepID=A0A9P6C3L5_9AGAR|nr:hypothetical protein P691DRAFT_760813 [Macrolepiota fuliginosa MF-IS2]